MADLRAMTDSEVAIHVIGHPQPGGSKRAFPVRAGGQLTGKVAVTDDNPRAKDWKALVIAAAWDVNDEGRFPLYGPLSVTIRFTLVRPKGHYRTGRHAGELRPTAPRYPIGRPDVSKLARSTIDALTGLVWRDDAQIVREVHIKTYGHPEGARITVTEIPA